MEWFSRAFHEQRWGDLASVAGFFVTFVGFAATLFQIARARQVSALVAERVSEVRLKISQQSLAVDLAALMNDIEEIKALHRIGAWGAMPSRYTSIRKRLLSLKSNSETLTKLQKSSIQGVIGQFKEIEEIVEATLASGEPPDNVARLNKLASAQSDKLTAVLTAVQQQIGA